MKQVQQNYRSGELKVAEVPAPAFGAGELLVATHVSLISSGTERQLMQLAKSSLVGKAAALCAEESRDDVVLDTVSTVEDLTVNLTRQIWQKITLINQLGDR